jgi:hypothetical protein
MAFLSLIFFTRVLIAKEFAVNRVTLISISNISISSIGIKRCLRSQFPASADTSSIALQVVGSWRNVSSNFDLFCQNSLVGGVKEC